MSALRKKIGLVGCSGNAAAKGLFHLLTDLFPGVCESANGRDDGSWAGVIVCDGDISTKPPALPSLVLMPSSRVVEEARVQFGNSNSVPAVFRNREVKQTQAVVFDKAALEGGDEIIASADGHPIWAARADDSCRRQICAVSFQQGENRRFLFEYLSGGIFVQLLPIIAFIRQVREEEAWTAPPARANMMFDDPNLHGVRYGWLDYARLIQSAREHKYHASFATIPLDAWFTSNKAAALLRTHSARLSLLVHGNNHVANEMARFPSAPAAIWAMSQALNRIRKLEQKAGVEVSKVVAAPHGACSEETLGIMARLGYEGACISYGSLRCHNQDKNWTRRMGMAMAEVVAGMPVIPRVPLSADQLNSILLAAYFDQPIVLVGHHQEAADGLKMVEAVADFINSIGEVRWRDMKTVCRGNFFSKLKGDELTIKTYTRICHLQIPAGITKLSVERPWLAGNGPDGLRISREGQKDLVLDSYAGETLPVSPGSAIVIESVHPDATDPVPTGGGINLLAFARRQLCECRDRLRPFFG
jgi:hypothetical protein